MALGSVIYERLIRPRLFRQDPERAHEGTMARLAAWRVGGPLIEAFLAVEDERLRVDRGPLHFRNPIGLAAGLDKHGEAAHAWPWLGFGACELGTITPRPQPGNPKPRLFRLPEEHAIINRFGFNSPGVEAVARHLEAAPERRADVPCGLNVGKNKDTAPEGAASDHRACIERLRALADYFVINVSSPNTPGLRALQQPVFLSALVADAVDAARGVPVLVKLAPDWTSDAELEETVHAVVEGGAFGIVATNTTLSREGLSRDPLASGGLSGRPLKARAQEVAVLIRRALGPDRLLIGVGGLETGMDVFLRLLAGADVVQVYSALIYRGPTLAHDLNLSLLRLLEERGFEDLRALAALRGPLRVARRSSEPPAAEAASRRA